MRYLILLLLLSSFTFAPTDRELLYGTWSIYELKDKNGKLLFSADKVKLQILIDERVKEQLEMYPNSVSEETLRTVAIRQFEELERTIYTFGQDDTYRISDSNYITESSFTVDEEQKELVLINEFAETNYHYSFNDQTLILKNEYEELILLRKK